MGKSKQQRGRHRTGLSDNQRFTLSLVMVCGVVLIECVALANGIDGKVLTTVVASLAAGLGILWGVKLGRKG